MTIDLRDMTADELVEFYAMVCDWCVTLDIPDELLTESKGRYRDFEEDDRRAWYEEPATKWRTEWCLKKYSTRTARIIEASDKYKYYLADLLNSIFSHFKP